MQTLSIGAVSKAAGVSVETIRFYEKERLLEKARRNESGYRLYSHDVIGRLSFIGKAKDLGFSLDEIRELIRLRSDRNMSCAKVREKAEEKIEAVESKIAELIRIKTALDLLVSGCVQTGATSKACSFLDALERQELRHIEAKNESRTHL